MNSFIFTVSTFSRSPLIYMESGPVLLSRCPRPRPRSSSARPLTPRTRHSSSPLHMSLNLLQKGPWEAVFGRAGDAWRAVSHRGHAALIRLPSLRSAGNSTLLTRRAKMWSKKCETDQHVAAGGREVQYKTIIKILMLNPRPLYPGITTSQLTVPDTAG